MHNFFSTKIFIITLWVIFSNAGLASNDNKIIEIKGLRYNESLMSPFSVTIKRPTLVVFLSAKCPCSHSHISHLQELKKQFPEIDFLAIHSNLDETEQEGKEYFLKNSLGFPVIRDEKNSLANLFRAMKTPHAYLLNSEGVVLYQGGVSNSSDCKRATALYLKDALKDLSENRPIKTPQTRTLGCALPR
jgi:hypothetical protein